MSDEEVTAAEERDDVTLLAAEVRRLRGMLQPLISKAVEEEHDGPPWYLFCRLCDTEARGFVDNTGELVHEEPFTHKPGCPVLTETWVRTAHP